MVYIVLVLSKGPQAEMLRIFLPVIGSFENSVAREVEIMVATAQKDIFYSSMWIRFDTAGLQL